MPTLTDDDQDQDYIDKGVSDLKDYADNETNPNESDERFRKRYGVGAGIGKLEQEANKGSGASDESVGNQERAGTKQENPAGYDNKWTGGQQAGNTKLEKALGIAKKRGGIFGLIALLGIGGAVMAGFFGPASMLINVMENFSITNDSSSTALERRFMKAFGFATRPSDPVCANSSTYKCKKGKISNTALNKLQRKGLVAVFPDGSTFNGKKGGYPSTNPSKYQIDLDDGKGTRTINAPDLPGFLADNPKAAARILGINGAFNLRVKAWTGKYITKKFYKKFNLNRNGGIADGRNKKLAAAERRAAAVKKLKARIPGASQITGIADGIKAKVGAHLGKAKKGGAGYTAAVAGCIGVKAPGYIAGGVAAVQLAQILPVVMDVILSPGAKAKSAAIGSGFSSDDMDLIGSLMTEKTPRESDGKMTSALDSPYLLAAMGVNKSPTGVSQKFTPGFSFLSNPAIIAANSANKELEPTCNAIMSPAAMYSALAVDSAVTVALAPTVVGGIIKVAAGLVISEIAIKVTEEVVGEAAKAALVDLASNDDIPTAEGEELGDVLGIAAPALFSAGGMARNLPTLKESQVPEFTMIQKETEDFHREMDIASLSPFDTSSRYTFLGSALYNAQMAVMLGGDYGSPASIFSSLLSLPSSMLSPKANAAGDFNTNYCSYAAAFGLTTQNPADTPAINAAGLPCTGITGEQTSMSTDEAIDLIQSEGWLDETVDISDEDTIEELVSKGYIKGDTPMSDFIESCGAADSGDYLFNAAGCTVVTSVKTPGSADCVAAEDDSGGTTELCGADGGDWADYTPPEGIKDSRSMAAISTFLLDFQDIELLNEDESTTGIPSDVEDVEEEDTEETEDTGDTEEEVDTSPTVRAPTLESFSKYSVTLSALRNRSVIWGVV